MFLYISFTGIEYPEIRFLGFAVLNAVSTTLWWTVINDAINHVIDGDTLTDWRAFDKSCSLCGSILGCAIAIIFVDMSVEWCVAAQCAANIFMGATDLKAFNVLSQKAFFQTD